MEKMLPNVELERRAQIRAHTCMCGCGKGCSGYKDEPTDPNEKLDRLTETEINQQKDMLTYADPFDILIYREMVESGEIDPDYQRRYEEINGKSLYR